MKRRIMGALILVTLVAAMFLGACASPFAEQAKTAKERVQRETVAEKELLYDDGQNFLVVNSVDWAVITEVLRQWRDQHPGRHLVFGGLAYADTSSDRPNVWIVYYE